MRADVSGASEMGTAIYLCFICADLWLKSTLAPRFLLIAFIHLFLDQ